MRLIDADALMKNIGKIPQLRGITYSRMKRAVEETPTIDAEPERHGRWVECQGKSNIWYCSECGEKINYKQNRRTYNIPKVPVWQKNKRCRNCGAKMDGGAEDD